MDCSVLKFLVVFVTWISLDLTGEVSSEVSSLKSLNNSSKLINPIENLDEEPGNENKRWKRGYYVDQEFSPGPANWGGNMMSKLKRRTSNLLGTKAQQAMSYGNHGYGGNSDDYEVIEDSDMAGAFWNLYGSGGGYSGGGGGYGKYVNKSAVGLLGFLSLLSLIQNGLSTTTAAAAMPMPMPMPPGKRRKRDADGNGDDLEEESGIHRDRITDMVLPMLLSLASVRDKGTPLKCVLRQVCETNKKLVTQFEERGQSVGVILGNGLVNILRQIGTRDTIRLRYAGKAGRNGKDCMKLYKIC